MPTRIYLIRHGQTGFNAEGRIQGQMHNPLSQKGHRQAKALARRIQSEGIESLHASDLLRTRQTAEPISEATGLPITFHTEFREICLGDFQGLTWREAESKFPKECEQYVQDPFDFVFPNGENFLQVRDRSFRRALEIAHEYEGQRIAVVTHGGPIGLMLVEFLMADITLYNRILTYNTSVNIVERGANGWEIVALNDTCHLTPDLKDE